ncbi:MAG TPA: hypothetical protein PLK67_11640, partial [Bryobacteraceae bacterium]|nr:hypothetical protein [Bryobacteraceae bacterium]
PNRSVCGPRRAARTWIVRTAVSGLTLFHEYFDGDTGRGLGASHHTGWTALITRLLLDAARDRDLERR